MEIYQGLPSYYSTLGVSKNASLFEIRSAFKKLAMKWHPDKWARDPRLVEEAKKRFQQIQEAYEVLSDHNKRTLYDAGLYSPEEETDQGFCDFVQEMVGLMANVRAEERSYTIDDLQNMFAEMVAEWGEVGFESVTEHPKDQQYFFTHEKHRKWPEEGACERAKRARVSAVGSDRRLNVAQYSPFTTAAFVA
ncbi:hypothetical protein AMTRI_Chr13g117760 [Amborella trichopoda]|uniref:J domain-containing protein n=1 Tax=Amborella trichopoda TaxID=13333 RepID=W1P3C5_AMBTC|nr:dnaJ homolog subfamily B member 6-A [Amborella trichopoda]ERN04357.1 hypothetical protein AMTR_s00147p00061530 [Amborella trichopoda]|eukprot:XP_020521852.1 dnaJ homolog subfamily B member 6-A [Amborella trichopoda]